MRRSLLPLLAAAAVLLSAVPVSAQTPKSEFVMEPTPGSKVGRRGYYVVKSTPGESITQSVGLRNDSKKELKVHLAAVDAVTGPIGGVSYGLPDDRVKEMGDWLSLDDTKVRLEPGGSEVVSFRIKVPNDADPGVHLAGLAAWVPPKDEKGNVESGEPGAAIVVQTRKVIAVQVELPGPSEPELTIAGVEPDPRTDAVYLEIGIENSGHGLTSGKGTIEIPEIGFERDFALDTFVPGTSIGYPIKWKVTPEDGEYETRVEIDYKGGAGHASWNGTFTIGKSVAEELDKRRGGEGPPWLLIAIGIGALLILALIVMLLRRRRDSRPKVTGGAPRGARRKSPPPPPPPPASRPKKRSPGIAPPAPKTPRPTTGHAGRDLRTPPPPPPPRS